MAKKRAPSGTLDRDRIADAALRVADRRGLAGVTMRAVATELGVSPMALYTYFTKKEQLLDSMFARILDGLFESAEGKTWQDELYAGCNRAREVLLAHPAWVPLLARPVVPPAALGAYERFLGHMGDREDASIVVSSALTFTLGSVLVERTMTKPEGVVPIIQLRKVRALLPRSGGRFPRVTGATASFDRWSFEHVFDAGLKALLEGAAHAQ